MLNIGSPCGDLNPTEQQIAETHRLENLFLLGGLASGGPSKVATEIAGGHALTKHLYEFAHLGIKNQTQFANHIDSVIKGASKSRSLSNGRKAYLDESTNTIIIFNPNAPDKGTAFIRKNDPVGYLNSLK